MTPRPKNMDSQTEVDKRDLAASTGDLHHSHASPHSQGLLGVAIG